MIFLLESGGSIAALLVAMLLSLELGRRIGVRRRRDDPEGADKGTGPIESAVFGLMGLIVAFTFGGALSRMDARRDWILKETNAIGTVWLRLDLLPADTRTALQGDLRRYTDRRLTDTQASLAMPSAEAAALQGRIWEQVAGAARAAPDVRIASLLLPALNEMFDIATARHLAVQTHPPTAVYVLLLVLALLCSLLAGYGLAGGRQRSWLHILCFTGSLLAAVYVIVDMEFPRRGLIRVDRHDQLLVDLRDSMK